MAVQLIRTKEKVQESLWSYTAIEISKCYPNKWKFFVKEMIFFVNPERRSLWHFKKLLPLKGPPFPALEVLAQFIEKQYMISMDFPSL